MRKALDLTQQKFADRLGMKQNTIATYEMGCATPSDPTIKSICREFNVSKEWLRTGDAEMFLPKADTTLELLAAEHSLTRGDRALIEKFLSLKPEDRKVLVDYARKVSAAIADQETAPALAPAHTSTIEEEARAEAQQHTQQIYEQILAEKKAAAGLSSESSGQRAGDGTAKQA